MRTHRKQSERKGERRYLSGAVSHAAHVDRPFPNIFQVCMALSAIRYFNIDTLSVFTSRRERLGEQSVHICTSFTLGDCTALARSVGGTAQREAHFDGPRFDSDNISERSGAKGSPRLSSGYEYISEFEGPPLKAIKAAEIHLHGSSK